MVIVRSFDRPYYRDSEPVLVTIQVAPDSTVKAYGVEENFPGWVISGVDNGGSSFPGVVKWGVFFDSNPRTFHYTLTPTGKGKGQFSGVVSFDGVSTPIGGSQEIGVDTISPQSPT